MDAFPHPPPPNSATLRPDPRTVLGQPGESGQLGKRTSGYRAYLAGESHPGENLRPARFTQMPYTEDDLFRDFEEGNILEWWASEHDFKGGPGHTLTEADVLEVIDGYTVCGNPCYKAERKFVRGKA